MWIKKYIQKGIGPATLFISRSEGMHLLKSFIGCVGILTTESDSEGILKYSLESLILMLS